MSDLVPEKFLQEQKSFNFAPIVDFLFILLAIFALLVFTQSIFTRDQTAASPHNQLTTPVVLTINEKGEYEWITEFNEFLLGDTGAVIREVQKQQQLGFLPQESRHIKILLEIHRNTKWHEVAHALFAIREAGFSVSPVYSAPVKK
jgi:biopolymer transport protein ExbD